MKIAAKAFSWIKILAGCKDIVQLTNVSLHFILGARAWQGTPLSLSIYVDITERKREGMLLWNLLSHTS